MATKFDSTLLPINDTDAHFRAWATFIDTLLRTTGGWTKSTQTGEADPTTIAHPTVANTKQGFRVYAMADTLQGTSPVFIRIDWGSGAGANTPAIWITIGTGADGSGGITGTVLAATRIAANSNSSSQANNSYGSADTNRVTFALFIQSVSSNYPILLGIERTKDSTGADTGTGLLIAYTVDGSAQFGVSQYLILAGGTQASSETGLSYILPRKSPSETFGGDIGVGILIHFRGIAQQPGANWMFTNTNDVSVEGSISMSLYGATRTYQQLNSYAVIKAIVGSSGGDTSARILMRYD